MSDDEGRVYDEALLCVCCEEVTTFIDPWFDFDLNGAVCRHCGPLLRDVSKLLNRVRGIRGCAPLGPDSGKGVLS